MKSTLAATVALAAAALFSQPARAATMVEIEASATGTTSSLHCMTVPQCQTTDPFAAAFTRVVTLGDFVDGAAFFQIGANGNGGLLSGTVRDLGGGLMTGVNFSFSQTRVCSSTPCLNISTSLAASTFSVRQFLPGMTSAVPEPGTWATMLIGFGAIGGALRRARRQGRPALALA